MKFVINWRWQPSARCYITKTDANSRPYESDPSHPRVKTWTTRAQAERFLRGKDPGYASNCVIEAIRPV